jgi:hypothetical protein
MIDKEQLQTFLELKACVERYDYSPFYTGSTRGTQNIRFLISMIEQQQQEIDRLNNLYLDREKSLLDTIAACENLDEQLRQANEKLQEIKRACEYFKTTQDYYDSFLVNLIEEILEERK